MKRTAPKCGSFVQNPVWKRVKGNTEPEQPVLQAEEPFFTESQDKTLESGAAEKKLSAEGQEKVLESRKEEESFFTECQDKTLESRATEKTLSVEGQEKVLESWNGRRTGIRIPAGNFGCGTDESF